MGPWQPIESAPKDCTWVQLWRRPVEFGSSSPLIIARWSDEYERFIWPRDPFDPFTPRGRKRAEEDMDENDYFEDEDFTHWMPLPPPPAQ